MLFLSVFVPSILSGCVPNCPNCVTTEDLDAALARIDALEEDNAELHTDLAEAGYLTAADLADYAKTTEVNTAIANAVATCATEAALTAEVSDRMAADTAEATARQADDTTEATTRAAADAALADADAAEASARMSADASVAAAAEQYCDDAVAEEASLREQGDQEVQASLDTLSGEAIRLLPADFPPLDVPSVEYPTLNEALTYLEGFRITSTVTINLTDVSYSFYAPIEIHHPDGGNIHIVGNTADATPVTLNFYGVSGFVVRNGSALGLLDGVTLDGHDTSPYANGSTTVGVEASVNASVILGTVNVQRFLHGVEASGSSTVEASGVVTVTDCFYGFVAENGSYLEVPNAHADFNYDGYVIELGSALRAPGATADQNDFDGFNFGSSTARVEGIHATSNGRYGVIAGESIVDAPQAEATDNGDAAFFASGNGATISAYQATVSGTSYVAEQSSNGYVFLLDYTDTSATPMVLSPYSGYYNDITDFIYGYP